MRVRTVEVRYRFLEVIYVFDAHSSRIIVIKIMEKGILTAYFFRKKHPILVSFTGRRKESDMTPTPNILFKIVFTNGCQTYADRVPSIEDVERKINAVINFNSSWILAPAPP